VDTVLAALSGRPHELLVTCAREAVAHARDRVSRDEIDGSSADDVIFGCQPPAQSMRCRELGTPKEFVGCSATPTTALSRYVTAS